MNYKPRVLLIWPPITVFAPDTLKPGMAIPHGLAYIAAVLEKHNYEVAILDSLIPMSKRQPQRGEGLTKYGLDEIEVRGKIKEFSPDIVGISSMFTAYAKDVYDCARIVKELNKNTLVIVGGAHVSINPSDILTDKNIDIVVKGEGENTFLEIIQSIDKGQGVSNIAGTVVKVNGQILTNADRPFIRNLDDIPMPAYHLLDIKSHLDFFITTEKYNMRHPHMEVVSSRGCPGRCAFCSIHSVWGKAWRGRSAKNVVDEIEFLVKKYDIGEIAFLDDNFSLDKKRAFEICQEIIDRKLDIKWCTPNGVALMALDEKLIRKMKESGCYRLTFGIESGSNKVQRFIGKSIDINRAKSVIKFCNRIGLWTASTFIFGFPEEQEQDMLQSISYAIECDTDLALFYILVLYPGTRAYDVSLQADLLKNNPDPVSGLSAGGYGNKYFTRQEISAWQSRAHREFFRARFKNFLNPLRILRKITSFEDFLYVSKIVWQGIVIISRQARFGVGDVKLWLR